MNREKLELEFEVRSSPSVLFPVNRPKEELENPNFIKKINLLGNEYAK